MSRSMHQARTAQRGSPARAASGAGVLLTGELLRTKLRVPPPRPDPVPRPRLLGRLTAGLRGRLTLIAAPAGFGKTTLLGAWRATEPGRAVPLAWVSLDAGDNDLVRFWRYVIAALDELHPGLGAPALSLLHSPRQPPIETVLTTIINGLANLSERAVLILDDYHVIVDQPIHRSLTFLLEHLPLQLHLIITSRVDPPLPLARMRGRGELAELRSADLRFSAEEAAHFLSGAAGSDLPAGTIAAIGERTEGWVAGLQLAALALRGHNAAEQSAFVAAFSGSNRYIVDYLVEEVLARQSPELQRFLLETAILDRLCGPLCDAVTGGTAGQETLEALERANLFIVPLDSEQRWYRYHHLFAEVLRQRLRQARSDQPQDLHRRASAWFAGQEMIPEAVEHALAARAAEDAAALVERHGLALAVRGEVTTVRGWLEALPDQLVRERPRLCILHATILMYGGESTAAEARLIAAERLVPPSAGDETARVVLGWAATIRGDIARIVGDIARCTTLSHRALELLPETEGIARAAAELNAARTYFVSGDLTAANERQAEACVATARASGNLHATLTSLNNLARVRTMQGKLDLAVATFARAAEAIPGEPGAYVNGAAYHFGLGVIHYERNNLEAVEQHLEQGLALAEGGLTVDAGVLAFGYATWARLLHARGDAGGARAALAEFATLATARGFAAPTRERIDAMGARLALSAGDIAAAQQWATANSLSLSDAPDFQREETHLTLVRLHLARAKDLAGPRERALDLGDALALLDRLLLAAEIGNRVGSAIEIHTLRALALDAGGETAPALAALGRALALGEPGGYRRVFLDEGPPLAALLRRLVDARPANQPASARDYAAQILAIIATGNSAPTPPRASQLPGPMPVLTAPLSEREIAVLRLMAVGHANPEIASQLFVATSTVKWYVNSIFSKLSVTSRTAAVARARALGLLSD
jgi:ATP/maltotriose-dependent transcriptional regulator MalT